MGRWRGGFPRFDGGGCESVSEYVCACVEIRSRARGFAIGIMSKKNDDA